METPTTETTSKDEVNQRKEGITTVRKWAEFQIDAATTKDLALKLDKAYAYLDYSVKEKAQSLASVFGGSIVVRIVTEWSVEAKDE